MTRISTSSSPGSERSSLLRYGELAAYVALSLAFALTIWNLAATSLDRQKITSENQIILTFERLLSAARDIEVGSRGFVLVGDDAYLEPYQASQAALDGFETNTKALWVASGRDAADLDGLLQLIERKRFLARELVTARRTRGFAAAQSLISIGEGKSTMDSARIMVGEFQAQSELEIFRIERRDRSRTIGLTTTSLILAGFGAIYLGWLAWYRRRETSVASEALLGLGDRFQTLADNIPQLAWMADSKGSIYWYNQRWYDYTGTTPAEMANDGWRKVHDPEALDDAAKKFFDSVTRGELWEDTFKLRGRDGNYRWFLSRALPIRTANGDIVRWFGTNTDITEERLQGEQLAAARDEAEEANRTKSQFLANMSHELRTPLTAVIGYSEMLEDEAEENGQDYLLKDLAKIKANARHLLSLINDVLDISKIEANKMEIFNESFEIPALIDDVVATIGSLIEKKQNRLIVEVPPDLGAMRSDVTKVRQIIINFLSNAAKFTENGTITLRAQHTLQHGIDSVVLSVRDSGLGMTDEQVAALFQRFSQADKSTTRRFGGTGLGLSISKAFADMLGGKIDVISTPGEGSTFSVTIPCRPPFEHSFLDAESASIPHPPGSDVVLVIDDDPNARELLTRVLSREGFVVRSAENGVAGLHLAETLKPRVILLDVTMPHMDGWTVLRSLKERPDVANIPVIMCTIIDEKTLGFSLGASDYLVKPVDWDNLKTVLARIHVEAAHGDILIVDDDADTRKRVRGLLARHGWSVAEASDGKEALIQAERKTPSVVLLDINMPNMDGFAFLREFRTSPSYASIPVVVMTARDLSMEERAELAGGGARIFQKGRLGMEDLVAQLQVFAPQRKPSIPSTAPAN